MCMCAKCIVCAVCTCNSVTPAARVKRRTLVPRPSKREPSGAQKRAPFQSAMPGTRRTRWGLRLGGSGATSRHALATLGPWMWLAARSCEPPIWLGRLAVSCPGSLPPHTQRYHQLPLDAVIGPAKQRPAPPQTHNGPITSGIMRDLGRLDE